MEPTSIYDNNQSVVISTTNPRSTLKKKYNALSYYRTRKSIDDSIIGFKFVISEVNWDDTIIKAHLPCKYHILNKKIFDEVVCD